MAERVYFETTVVSYLVARPNRDVVIAGHQQVTHEWWDTRRGSYELCVSQLVLGEAAAGDETAARERMAVFAADDRSRNDCGRAGTRYGTDSGRGSAREGRR